MKLSSLILALVISAPVRAVVARDHDADASALLKDAQDFKAAFVSLCPIHPRARATPRARREIIIFTQAQVAARGRDGVARALDSHN